MISYTTGYHAFVNTAFYLPSDFEVPYSGLKSPLPWRTDSAGSFAILAFSLFSKQNLF